MIQRVFLSVVLLITSATVHAGVRDGRLDIYWIDVEGGASTLIVTPVGESVLIDTGNPGFRDPQRIVRVATEVAGIRKIDHLITTHYHGDHYGGAATLATLMPIGIVHDNGTFEGMPDNPGKEYFGFACDKRVVINPGDKIELKPGAEPHTAPLSLQCLGTRQKFIELAKDTPENENACASARMKERDGSDNANSVVMLLSYGPFQFFDAGDLTWNREYDLVCPKNRVGEVDVYQVTHHGLDSSNNPLVLRTLKPTVAVMNNGFKKGCLPEVFTTLKETQSLKGIYQVHKNLRPDGATHNVADEYIANKEDDKTCKGNHIQLSLDPTGRSYKVSIPATGHERTYETK